MVSLADLVTEVNQRGYLVSSIYQKDDKTWGAMVRPVGDFSFSHGSGKSPIAALKQSLKGIRKPLTEKDWEKVAKNKVVGSVDGRVRVKKRRRK